MTPTNNPGRTRQMTVARTVLVGLAAYSATVLAILGHASAIGAAPFA